MGLSAFLLGYAENIWRRFPEEFISLGSPDLEACFELHEGAAACHRVVESKSQKVIEIVLPRRVELLASECPQQLSSAPAQDAPLPPEWYLQETLRAKTAEIEEETTDLATSVAGCREANSNAFEVDGAHTAALLELDRLSQVIGMIPQIVTEEVQKQVDKQLRDSEVRRLLSATFEDLQDHSPVTADNCESPTSGATIFSPTSSVMSELAYRRGFNITSVRTSNLRKSDANAVVRMPQYDRKAIKNSTDSGLFRARNHSSMSTTVELYPNEYRYKERYHEVIGPMSSVSAASSPGSSCTPAEDGRHDCDSPGALLQRAAKSRRMDWQVQQGIYEPATPLAYNYRRRS